MTAVGEVNKRVTDLAATQRQDAHEFYREVVYARQAWSRSEDRSTALEALIRAQEACVTALEAQTRHEHDRHRELARTRDAERQDRPVDKMPPKKTTTPMTDAVIKHMIAQGVADALAEHEANRNSRNGDNSHKSRSGGRRTVPTTRECTYSDFLKCQTLNFKGTEGVIDLTQWFENMKSVFHISNCIVACQIKFATCTLLGSALTWWNSYVKTVGHDAAYGMP
ncbi:hypothetical protein Tco_1238828 [Tanacetum coccineum]